MEEEENESVENHSVTLDTDGYKDYMALSKYFKENVTTELPTVVELLTKAIYSDGMSYKMARFIALQEATILASMTGKTIQLNNLTKVTINIFNLMLSKSGSSKDKSVSIARNSFKEGYQLILDKINYNLVLKAKLRAKSVYSSDDKWKDFYKGKVNSLFPSVSTTEGMLSQLEKLQEAGLGAYSLNSSEFMTELKNNSSLIIDNLKTAAIGYDLGNIAEKIVKTDTLKIEPINSINLNVTLFSSAEGLDNNQALIDRFKELMNLQYSRRSLVLYNTNMVKPKTFGGSLVDMVNFDSKATESFNSNAELLKKTSTYIVQLALKSKDVLELPFASDVKKTSDLKASNILALYKRFCKYKADNSSTSTMVQLTTEHAYWRALKLAGAFAILKGKTKIEPEHLFAAIGIVEEYFSDVKALDKDLDKEDYEKLADYIKLLEKSRGIVKKHTLIKTGIIKSTITLKALEELTILVNEYDTKCEYYFNKDKSQIVYKKLYKENTEIKSAIAKEEKQKVVIDDSILVSIKPFVDSKGKKLIWSTAKEGKDYRTRNSRDGYSNVKHKFFKFYEYCVNSEVIYSPYQFKDGVKTLDNIKSKTNTLVLDIDKSSSTIHEVATLLKEYRFVMATTSDNKNLNKFRIVLQLDMEIDLDPQRWRVFYRLVCTHLGLEVDSKISKATGFLGYRNSVVVSNDGRLFTAKPFVVQALATDLEESNQEKVAKLSDKEMEYEFDDRYEHFERFYDIDSDRIPNLYNAMRSAIDRGWHKQFIEDLIVEINETFPRPVSITRIKREVLGQLHKWL